MNFANKLSFSILATGILVLMLLSIAVYKSSYNSIIKLQLEHTQSIAHEISDDIDLLLNEKIKTALTLANTPIIKNELESSNLFYSDLSSEKRNESIKLLDDKWKSINNTSDNFILKFTDNKVSHFLKDQQKTVKDEYGEIFLTNKFGALVASTAKLTTFAHGHKYWWLGAYNGGEGAVFFDDRGYDDSVDGYVLGLVVPIRKGTEIIGILKCNLNILGSISQLISGAENHLFGKFKLTRSGGMVVFEEGFEPLSTQMHGSVYKKLKSKNTESFIIEDSGEKFLVGASEIKLTRGEKGHGFGGSFESIDHKKGNKGESWYILCYRQMRAVLAPSFESIKLIALTGVVTVFILAFISQIFGRKMSKPVSTLDKALDKIGEGDFNCRIEMKRTDEFGKLADSFNSMAGPLQHTTTSLGLLKSEVNHRKQAEKELRKSEDQYRSFIENSPDIIIRFNIDCRHLYISPSAKNIMTIEPNNVIGRTHRELGLPKEQCRFWEHNIKEIFETGNSIETEHEVHNSELILNLRMLPEFNIEGKVATVLTIARDITEQKKIKEDYQLLFEKMLDGFALHEIICDESGDPIDYRFLAANPAFEKIICHKSQDIVGKTVLEVLPGIEYSWIDKYGKVALTGEPIYFEDYLQELDSYFEVTAYQTRKKQFACIFQDVTERTKSQIEKEKLAEQLLQTQKMESIGTLAGGIAHNFNNILSPIMIHCQLATINLPSDSPIHSNLEEISKAAEIARDMVEQILTFSRKEKGKKAAIKIIPILKEVLKLLRTSIPTTIEIKQTLYAESDIILADPTKIRQVLLDLCTNAAHAMREKGGILEVSLTQEDLYPETTAQYTDLNPGSYLKLTVTDNGSGIDGDIMEKIFEPYFTTKEVGEGTGLGLAVVHGIVKDLRGEIFVRSEAGKGTTFDILLPRIGSYTPAVKEEKPDLPKGSESVLFIDDEVSAVNANQAMLENLGYKVTARTNSIEALEVFRNNSAAFDLVITDMTMPNMTGKDLAKKLISIRPGIPIILCTGFSDQINEESAKEIGIKAFIMKPIVMREMAETIRKVLE